MNDCSSLTIIIPCYNEAENISHVFPPIIHYCNENNYKLIAVDDGSSDNTFQELKKFNYPNLTIYRHSLNRGYGAAIKTGILSCETNLILSIDADGQHHLPDISKLMYEMDLKDADLVVGNRKGVGSSSFRNFGKSIILNFTRLFFKLPINDLNSGMKLYKTDIVRSLIQWTPNGMAFSDVITLLHFQLRYKIVDYPIKINPRTKGSSTINWRTAVYTISEIAFLVVNIVPFRFFGFLSFLLFTIALIWNIPFVSKGEGITVGGALLFTSSLIIFLQGVLMELLVRLRYQNYIYISNKK